VAAGGAGHDAPCPSPCSRGLWIALQPSYRTLRDATHQETSSSLLEEGRAAALGGRETAFRADQGTDADADADMKLLLLLLLLLLVLVLVLLLLLLLISPQHSSTVINMKIRHTMVAITKQALILP
jgi:hypothetical protein